MTDVPFPYAIRPSRKTPKQVGGHRRFGCEIRFRENLIDRPLEPHTSVAVAFDIGRAIEYDLAQRLTKTNRLGATQHADGPL